MNPRNNRPSPLSRMLLILCVVILYPVAIPAAAEPADEDLQFVYGTNHYDGYKYASVLIPPSVDSVFLLADVTNILASRLTEVYYWPITNEYRANWEEANIIVDGTLEILQGDSVIAAIEQSDYVIQYDGKDRLRTLELFLGEEAVAARQRFEELREKYRDDLFAYQSAMSDYRSQMEEALADLEAGTITEAELPKQPEPLEDMTLFSTELLRGFSLNLPQGQYTIQLRLPDGGIQPESRKALTVFTENRFGVGYNVLSEERWNMQEQSMDSIDTIYSRGANTLFFQPFQCAQYNRKYYIRMNNPQDKEARADQTIWVPLTPMDDADEAQMALDQDQVIGYEEFFVRQLPGSKLGYEIVPFDPFSMSEPSFGAYRVELDETAPGLEFHMIDERGVMIPGSDRKVRALRTERAYAIYLISAFPLLIGIGIVMWRQSRVKRETAHE